MQDETYENRLAPLSKLKLDLRLAPAVHLVLVKNDYSDPTSDFIMAAGDDKKQRNTIYKELLYFICDIGTWEDQDIAEQRAKAFAFLHSSLTNEEKNQWWDEVINQKS